MNMNQPATITLMKLIDKSIHVHRNSVKEYQKNLLPIKETFQDWDEFKSIIYPLTVEEIMANIGSGLNRTNIKDSFLLFQCNGYENYPKSKELVVANLSVPDINDFPGIDDMFLPFTSVLISSNEFQCEKIEELERCEHGSGMIYSADLEKKTLEVLMHADVYYFLSQKDFKGKIYLISGLFPFKRILDSFSRNIFLPPITKNPLHLLGQFTTEIPEEFQIDNPDYHYFNVLNDSQKEAIKRSLTTLFEGGVSLIKGPPGTGKTTANCALLRLYFEIASEEPLLQTAPTNAAMVEIASKFYRLCKDEKSILEKMVIVGNRPKLIGKGLLPSFLRPFYMEEIEKNMIDDFEKGYQNAVSKLELLPELIKESNEELLAKANKLIEETTEIWEIHKKEEVSSRTATMIKKIHEVFIRFFTKWKENFEEAKELADFKTYIENREVYKTSLFQQLAILKAEARSIVYKLRPLVFVTVNSSVGYGLQKEKYTLAIVDEGTQCSEAHMMTIYRRGLKSLILIGDTNQLPATIISENAKKMNLTMSLFERLEKLNHPVYFLNEQYRMHPSISQWPRNFVYLGRLQDHNSVSDRQYPYYNDSIFKPLVIFDTGLTNESNDISGSKMNVTEIDMTMDLLRSFYSQLVARKGAPPTIGLITPYSKQKLEIIARIKATIAECNQDLLIEDPKSVNYIMAKQYIDFLLNIKTDSIDAFQGQECDIVILSLTRSNQKGEIGFFSDLRRVNVALTRAKHSLWIIGDLDTFEKSNTFWTDFIRHARRKMLVMGRKDKKKSEGLMNLASELLMSLTEA